MSVELIFWRTLRACAALRVLLEFIGMSTHDLYVDCVASKYPNKRSRACCVR